MTSTPDTISPLRRVIPQAPLRPRAVPFALRAVKAVVQSLAAVSPERATDLVEHLWFRPRRFGPPPKERGSLASAERAFLEVPGGRVATYVWSHGGLLPWEQREPKGTVMLVHGWEGRAGQLWPLVEPLREAGYRVVAFDAPAHGQSSGARADLFEFGAALRRVAAAYGPIDAIVAHSMGGPAAVTALNDGLDVPKIVLIGSPARLERAATRFAQMLQLPAGVEQSFRARLEARFGSDLWERFDVARSPAAFTTEALFIHDLDDDEVAHSEAVHASSAWPHARLISTAGLGHRRILRDLPVIEEAIKFVAKEPSAS